MLLVSLILSSLALLSGVDKSLAVEMPKAGGTLEEGIVGTPRFVNPILAISDADRDAAALIYSGLMRVGKNGDMVPDLAESYEISEDGRCYKFVLKPDLRWPDDAPLSTDDIIFTIELVKNKLTQSPKRASWEGVEPEKINEKELRFCLPKAYTPFLENTTLGILPKHLWQDLFPEQMPLSDFNNIKPMGSGPYKIKKVSRTSSGIITSYTFEINENFCLSHPYIKTLILKFYPSEKKLLEAYEKDEIDSLYAVSIQNILALKKTNSFLKTYNLPRVFGVFFNQANAPVLTDASVRAALSLSVDKEKIISEVLKGFGVPLFGPIPLGSLGAIKNPEEERTHEELLEEAVGILKKAGWKMNDENFLEKTAKNSQGKNETVKLEFSLSTSNSPELTQTAQLLKEMWGNLGAKVQVKNYETGDLEQNVIRTRKYDGLLFGEIMSRDPDPFAFWHSSQRNDPGLNIALYANISADKLLEETRALVDTEKKVEKYQKFQEEVLKDNAAVFLYSPEFIYLLPNTLKGVGGGAIITPAERFANIYDWYINTKKVWKIFD